MYYVQIQRGCDDLVFDSDQPLLDENYDEHTMYYEYVRRQAFLWHHVRCMGAVFFDVGQGREDTRIVCLMLDDVTNNIGKGDCNTGCDSDGGGEKEFERASSLMLCGCDTGGVLSAGGRRLTGGHLRTALTGGRCMGNKFLK